MTLDTLQNDLEAAALSLLTLARDITYNTIPDHCQFILSEIKYTGKNFREQWQITKKGNEQKTPTALATLIPELEKIYADLYDINLHIYKVKKEITIIEISYFLKSSYAEAYRKQVAANPPMLHCKVTNPPWLSDKKEKFDINWQHHTLQKRWKIFWGRAMLKIGRRWFLLTKKYTNEK